MSKFVLYDLAEIGEWDNRYDSTPKLNGRAICERGLDLFVEGYGVHTSEDGHGAPIYLEYYGGHLRLLVWADINKEEPTHVISLSEAKESNRGTQ